MPMINYKATNAEVDPQLQEVMDQKLASLEKYIGDETDVNCDVEFEKVTASQSGKVHRVTVNLWLAGTLHRAEATEMSFEEAIDEVRNELDKELRRSRSKQDTLMKRGGRALKKMMRME